MGIHGSKYLFKEKEYESKMGDNSINDSNSSLVRNLY